VQEVSGGVQKYKKKGIGLKIGGRFGSDPGSDPGELNLFGTYIYGLQTHFPFISSTISLYSLSLSLKSSYFSHRVLGLGLSFPASLWRPPCSPDAGTVAADQGRRRRRAGSQKYPLFL